MPIRIQPLRNAVIQVIVQSGKNGIVIAGGIANGYSCGRFVDSIESLSPWLSRKPYSTRSPIKKNISKPLSGEAISESIADVRSLRELSELKWASLAIVTCNCPSIGGVEK